MSRLNNAISPVMMRNMNVRIWILLIVPAFATGPNLFAQELHGVMTHVGTPTLLVREVPNATRAALDWAAWQNNPLLANDRAEAWPAPGTRPALDDIRRFDKALAPDTASNTPPRDLPTPVVWNPFVEWLQREAPDAAAPFLDAAYEVSREKWGLRTVTQRIAVLHWDGTQRPWVRVDFDPQMETAADLSDTNGDGAPEFYAQLADNTSSAAPWLQRYLADPLTPRALDIYFNELAAAWYDKHYVFARDPAAFAPFPNPRLDLPPGDIEALKDLRWVRPSAVIERPAETDEGQPTGGRFLAVFRAGPTPEALSHPPHPFARAGRSPSPISEGWSRVSNVTPPDLTAFTDALTKILESTTETDRVIPGREPGVLFLRRALEYLAAKDLATQESPPMPVLVDFAAQLKARNVRFVFVPIPVKAAIYPDWFADISPDAAPNTAGQAAFEELRAAGVEVWDPAPALRAARRHNPDRLFYLKTDTHWTPAGAELVAEWLATELVGTGFERGTAVTSLVPREISFKGNLVRMLPEDEQTRVAPESHVARQVLDANGAPLSDQAPDAALVLLGDSYLTIYQREQCGAAGFAAHLARALGQPVDLIANQGGGPQSRIDFARRIAAAPDGLTGRRVVVLAMSERDLYRPFGGWKPVKLP